MFRVLPKRKQKMKGEKKMNEINCPNCNCLMEAGTECIECGTKDYTEIKNQNQ